MIDQGSPEWVAARVGKLTASRMAAAMSFDRSGRSTKARESMLLEVLTERITMRAAEHYVSSAMQWGIDHEDEAAQAFEERSGLILMRCGLVEHPRIRNFAATPDRVTEDAVVEIKCPTTQTFVRWVLAGEVPEEHVPQILAQCAVTGLRKAIFVAYDPRVSPVPSERLFVRQIEVSDEQVALVEEAAKKFLSEVDAMFDEYVRRQGGGDGA